ncbi:MAG TPA: calcium-binding protein [Allosphingosinicella sp.]|jgi:Ca2+-binding RTX toxin-like protein
MGTILGSAAANHLVGTEEADHILGADGNDKIEGKGGDDLLEGGNHDDDLDGGAGSDVLRGGEGNDRLYEGTSGASAENDEMYGDAGDDDLYMDRRTAIASTLVMDGGTGRDRISYNSWYNVDRVTLTGGDGDDTIFAGSAKTLIIDAGAGADRLRLSHFGTNGETIAVTLGEGSDHVELLRPRSRGEAPSDALRFTDFAGGEGGDRITFDAYLGLLTGWDSVANPFATGHLSLVNREGVGAVLRIDRDGGGDAWRDFILFEGTDAATLGVWNIGWNAGGAAGSGRLILGDGAANLLDGSGEGDLIRGFEGNDTIDGHAGGDLIEAGDGNDDVEGGWGHDRIHGEAGDDVLGDHFGGDDSLYGGEGNDTLTAERSSFVPYSAVLLDGGAGNDRLTVAPLNETPYRRYVDDVTLLGGEGNDYIDVNAAKSAVIDAGAGSDTVSINAVTTNYRITLGTGVDSLQLWSSAGLNGTIVVTDMETGSGGDFLVIDGYLRRQLAGWDPATNPYDQGFVRLVQRGADSVLEIDRDGPSGAGAFADLIVFQNAEASTFASSNLGGYAMLTGTDEGETIHGTGGIDLIRGNGGNDILYGEGSGDTLEGGAGDDTLDGGSGKDRLDGGTGADTMTGGSDDDVYIVDDHGDVVVETGYSSNDTTADEVRTALSSYTLAAEVEVLTGLSAGGQVLTGNARPNSIWGGAGNDVIYLLGGGGGTQAAYGGAGDDRLEGGADNDTLWGGPGADLLLGHGGNDFLAVSYSGVDAAGAVNRAEGGEGNDRIEGGAGDDILLGGGGDDNVADGFGGNDLIDGGEGNDVLSFHGSWNAPARQVTVLGGSGNDSAHLSSPNGGTLTVDLGEGDDFVNFNSVWGTISVTLGTGRDTLSLSPYRGVDLLDTLTVTDFAAGAGGDVLAFDGWLAANLTGWNGTTNPFTTGHLRLVQTVSGAVLQIDLNGGGDAYADRFLFGGTDAAAFTAANFQAFAPPAVHGTAAGDTVRGSAGDDRIESGGGRDMLRLEQGGDDTAFGGSDVDSFYFGAAFTALDRVDGGDDRDSLILQGDYTVTLGADGVSNVAGIESISLISGGNGAYGDTAGRLYSYDLTMLDGNVAAGGLMKVNGFHLQAGEDFSLDASSESDAALQVFAGLGRDDLTGGGLGDAFIFGHDGRFAAGDRVDGGGGYDVVYLRGDYAIDFNAAGFEGAFTNVESIAILTSANNEFAGGGDGEFDYDIVWADTLLAEGATFTVNASRLQAHESFAFDGSRETSGVLRLFGGAAADTLTGGGGADQLHGGGGADVLTGGAGADLFRYSLTSDSTAAAKDVIHGFVAGTDKIDLNRVDAKAATADTNEAFAFLGSNAFSAAGPNAPGELRAFQVENGRWQVEGDVNGDGIADLVIEVHVDAGQPLTLADFVL